MSQRIVYSKLRECDYVFTTSLSPLSCVIRRFEAGIPAIFDTSISTHVGMVLDMGRNGIPVFMVAEMLGDGLKIHPLSKYLNNGPFGDRIVCFKRHHAYDFRDTRNKTATWLIQNWNLIKYDYAGCFRNAPPLQFLKDKQDKFYCSELMEYLAQTIGGFTTVQQKHDGDNVTPYQIQISAETVYVNALAKD